MGDAEVDEGHDEGGEEDELAERVDEAGGDRRAVDEGEERDELRVRERQRLRSDLGAAVVRLRERLDVL